MCRIDRSAVCGGLHLPADRCYRGVMRSGADRIIMDDRVGRQLI